MCQLGSPLGFATKIPESSPITAYKVVRASARGTAWRSSFSRNPNGVRYIPGKTYAAHVAPAESHAISGLMAGFYAYRTPRAARNEARSESRYRGRLAVIRLELYGDVAIHADGYRAQCARVVSRKVSAVYQRAKAVKVKVA